jgi:hypothetical protein
MSACYVAGFFLAGVQKLVNKVFLKRFRVASVAQSVSAGGRYEPSRWYSGQWLPVVEGNIRVRGGLRMSFVNDQLMIRQLRIGGDRHMLQ